jgi:DNA-binding transcriptional regulator LsrR (DeoR family)
MLRGHHVAREIARDVGLGENAVNIVLSELKARGLVKVPIRGRFYVNETLIALALLDQIRDLEKRIIRVRGARAKPAPAPRFTPRAESTATPRGEPP